MTVFEKKQAFLGTFSLYTAFLLQYSYTSVACDASLICFSNRAHFLKESDFYILRIIRASYIKAYILTCAIFLCLIASSGFHIFLGCLVKTCVFSVSNQCGWGGTTDYFLAGRLSQLASLKGLGERRSYMCKKIVLSQKDCYFCKEATSHKGQILLKGETTSSWLTQLSYSSGARKRHIASCWKEYSANMLANYFVLRTL